MDPQYAPEITIMMEGELTDLGVKALKTPQEVDKFMKNQKGSLLLMVNSVCGCAASNARPGLKLALRNSVLPEKVVTVFAGVDLEATEKARSYIKNYGPSSPSFALFKNRRLVFMYERKDIVFKSPEDVSKDLSNAFEKYC